MTDPVTTAVITAVEAGTSKLELIFIAIVCLGLVFLGWYAHGIYTDAGQKIAVTQALKSQQASDQKQFDQQVKEVKAQAVIDKMNTNLNQDVQNVIVKTPKANCILTPDRVQLLHRAANRS